MGEVARPTLVLLHALGASARSWHAVADRLGDRFECIAPDLPGFGDNAVMGALTVEQTVNWLAETIRTRAPANWMVVGHSMGGKFATLLAARAEAGTQGLSGLLGVVLVAGSPPAPEPIDEDRRAEMIGWFEDGPADEQAARRFVDGNTADGGLPGALEAEAMADLRRSHPQAWTGWLTTGAREDWRAVVGRLATPALLVAGAQDEDLGEANQRRLNLPHYPGAAVEVVADAAHMLPYEQPAALAVLIAAYWDHVAARALPADFARLVASDRTSARTRGVLRARMGVPEPDVLDPDQRVTLTALIDSILPDADPSLDLTARVEAALGSDEGDGWRFAHLPPDAAALRRGLDTLDALSGGFAALAPDARGVWLDRMAAGDGGGDAPDALSGDAMRLWFEDVRAAAVRSYVAHPKTMARIGYDGFANGGDGVRKQGFLVTRAGERERWEPEPTR